MLAVERNYSKFRVKISEPGTQLRGYKVDAANLAEVHKAFDHYYGNGHPNAADDPECPLCRKVEKWVKANRPVGQASG